MNTEGPRKFTLPRRTVTECGACKYHVCHSSFHTRSGSGSWRDYACSHPDAFKDESLVGVAPEENAALVAHIAAIEKQSYGGRLIGRTEATPKWCPYLANAEICHGADGATTKTK